MRIPCTFCRKTITKDDYFTASYSEDGVYYAFCSRECECKWAYLSSQGKNSVYLQESTL
ncbi:MAG: hypothetical protein JSU72_08870 [Deltaproteobacteria bacterium]|nr:MAG: hypothetical protein JSU72_08870 [Deltaproteobacteria bacterium]